MTFKRAYLPKKLLISVLLSSLTIIALSACSSKDTTQDSKKGQQATLISVATSEAAKLEVREESIGSLEGLIDPTIAAEAAGRVTKINAHPGQIVKKGQPIVWLDATDYTLQRTEAMAEVARIEALAANQNRIVDRNQRLVQKKFISQNALEDSTTQQLAIQQQLDGAKARLAIVEHTKSKTVVLAPLDGVVQKQIVSTGDFVKVGDPLIQIISKQKLRAHLPLPESIAAKIRPGIQVRLSTPTSDKIVMSTIRELNPLIGETNRSIDVIADVNDEAGWQPGASVKGEIILGLHADAVLIPEQSLVLRPAGEVVYVIQNNVATQRIVKTGLRQDGKIEILDGLKANEIIAKDGAAFLTDQAKVNIDTAKNTQ